jgi:hypothetical protein
MASSEFQKDLETLLNKHSREAPSNTPDFILAVYLMNCLMAFDSAVTWRASWYGRMDAPGEKWVKAESPDKSSE